MRTIYWILCALALHASTACSLLQGRLPSLPRVHKISVQQGNVITQEMVDRLRPGMTKSQVHFVMGAPVLGSSFDDDRWVYVYTDAAPDEPPTHHELTVLFESDALVRMTGDLVPTDPQKAADAAKRAAPAAATTSGGTAIDQAPATPAPAKSATGEGDKDGASTNPGDPGGG
ncbi:MAG: outer membrane protein assembly factor BamE [Gammaproteobacteria bacterium]|nr:outer membrane protein assembly factor BamE [Gammaproteobacteria bacterium]